MQVGQRRQIQFWVRRRFSTRERTLMQSNSIIRFGVVTSLLLGVLGFSPSQANAASAAADKAQGGIAGYMVIMGISKLCNFDVKDPLATAVVGNINALKSTAGWTDKDLDTTMEQVIAALGKSKDTYCAPGANVFYSKIPQFEANAIKEADGSGVKLKPLPAADSAPTAAAKAPDAEENLNLAIMLEAVSDECDIKLKDGESLKIDRVQYYWRGKGDISAKKFSDLQKFWEDKVKTDHAKVCAKEFGFRPAFETALKTID